MILSFKRVSIANKEVCKGCANMFKLINNIYLQESVTDHYTNFTKVRKFHYIYQRNCSLNIFMQNLYANTEKEPKFLHI